MRRLKTRLHVAALRCVLGQSRHVETYSQAGEDLVLQNVFQGKLIRNEPGFYVDVGAYHPITYSNTYVFYRRFWRGLNIEARPGAKRHFDRVRPRDTNVEMAVADRRGVAQFLVFDEQSTVNRLRGSELAGENAKNEVTVDCDTLHAICREYVPDDVVVDFCSIDVEGMEERIVSSTDWEVFRPRVIVIESSGAFLKDYLSIPFVKRFRRRGYELFDVCKSYWPPSDRNIGTSFVSLFLADVRAAEDGPATCLTR